MSKGGGRLIQERAIEDGMHSGDGPRRRSRPTRSVTVNLAESPLGWLLSRDLITKRSSMPVSAFARIGKGPSWLRE